MKKWVFITLIFLLWGSLLFPQEEKKVLFVIASHNFRDEELLYPRSILEREGIKTFLASSKKNTVRGMLGTEVRVDFLIQEVEVKNFDAVIFIGGSGAREYWDNPYAHRLALQAVKEGKVLGAICIAPVTLAKAGVLKGKKATVWWSPGMDLRETLKKQGAIYTGRAVEVDGKIVTANGPQAAKKFGETILSLLKKK